jgi:hypothetical protein
MEIFTIILDISPIRDGLLLEMQKLLIMECVFLVICLVKKEMSLD